MKNPVYLFLLLILFSCGKISPKGDVESKDVPVQDFKNISLKGKFRVFVVNSEKSFVNVETYPNFFNNLDISVKDNTLNISEKRETKGLGFYSLTIYSRFNPEKISVSDSVEVNISGEINTDNFRLNLKNNGKFIGSIRSRKAEISMENTSLANFKGFTKNAEIKMKDTANLLAPYWMIDNLNIDSKNGTYSEVNVKDSLKGAIRDTSKFLYYNNPVRAFKIGEKANVQNKELE